jgi:hypothetical protein
MNVPGWLKDAIATPRGFISKKGELLKAVRMTAKQCDDFNNRKKEKPKTIELDTSTVVPTPIVVSEEETIVKDEITDTHSNIEITVTGADEDGDGVLSEDELRSLTKAKLESVARDYGIELDRRQSKKALLEELLNKIAE